MSFTKLIQQYSQKMKQSIDAVKHDQSYLLEFMLVVLLILLVILGIRWM